MKRWEYEPAVTQDGACAVGQGPVEKLIRHGINYPRDLGCSLGPLKPVWPSSLLQMLLSLPGEENLLSDSYGAAITLKF